MNGPDISALADTLHRLCPGFAVTGSPVRTGTSLLLPGSIRGVAVLAKQPTDPRPFWQDRCRHEIAVYQALASAGTAPVATPSLVAAEPMHPLLVITRLPGRPLHPDRYPAGPVPGQTLQRLLHTLETLHHWQPSAAFPDDGNYPSQLAAYRGGLIPPDDFDRIIRVCLAVMPPAQLQHGDAHLANALDTPSGVALIDLECTAWRPAGYDLAKLWVFLGSALASRAAILSALSGQAGSLPGFWVAVALVAAREITSHHRHPDLPGGEARIHQLHSDLNEALTRIRQLHTWLT